MSEVQSDSRRESIPAPSVPPIPSHPSFRELVEKAEAQIERSTFGYRDHRLAAELCKIIAEVYLFANLGKGGIRVDGEIIPYGVAAQVYETLGPEHLEYVIEDYRSRTYGVRNPKAYLRAALYNAAFKMELCRENECARDF